MLDKKQIQEFFFYSNSKWVIKQQRWLTTSKMHLAQELLKNVECSGGSSSFVKETRPLKMRHSMASCRSGRWPSQRITEADPLSTTQEVTKELNFSHSMVIWRLKQIWKVKKLDKWASHELTEKKKKSLFWSVLFSYFTQQWTSFQSDHDTESGFLWQLATTSTVVGRRRSSKALPKAKLAPRKGPCHCLVVCSLSHYSFLNPNKTIPSKKHAQQTNEMHQQFQCLQLALVKRMGPILLHDNAQRHIAQPTHQQLNNLGYKVLPHRPPSPGLWPTDYRVFKHLNNFLQKKSFLDQQKAENAFQGFIESQSKSF